MNYVLNLYLESDPNVNEALTLESQTPFGTFAPGDIIRSVRFYSIQHDLDSSVKYQVTRVEHELRDCRDEGAIDWEFEHALNVYLSPIP